jgi:hypothetical protein
MLHIAVENQNPTLVALLLGKGADISIRDSKGRTPLVLAMENNNKEILSLLANRTVSLIEELKGQIPSEGIDRSSLIEGSPSLTLGLSDSPLPNPPYIAPSDFPVQTPKLTSTERKELKVLSDKKLLDTYDAVWKPTVDKKIDAELITQQLDSLFRPPPESREALQKLQEHHQISKMGKEEAVNLHSLEYASIFRSHFRRESPVSEMLKISHFQTIYNIFVAVFLVSFLNILVSNFFENGILFDLSLVSYAFHSFPNAILVWCFMFTASFSAFFLQKLIVKRWISPRLAYCLYGIGSAALIIAVPKYIRYKNFPPGTCKLISILSQLNH